MSRPYVCTVVFGITVFFTVLGVSAHAERIEPSDLEYVRDLGYAAMKLLAEEKWQDRNDNRALVSIQGGKLQPIPFSEILNSGGKRIKVRMVSTDTESYAVARSYMIRLEKADLENKARLGGLARTCNMRPAEFAKRFGYLTQ